MSEPMGPFGWMTPAIAAMTRADPEFWRHAVAMDRAAMHALGLILSHRRAWRAADWHGLARALAFAPRRELAATFAPGVPLGAFALAGKLKGSILRPATYRRFAAVCRDAHARKWLAHAASITPADLLTLSRLPPAFRTGPFIQRARDGEDRAELRYRIAILRRVYPELPDHALARMMLQKGLRQSRWDFQNSFAGRLPFPPPPWPGDERLNPIPNCPSLERAGRAFRNCVAGRAADILTGRCAIYLYAIGETPIGVVEIVPSAVFGWEFSEALGPDNQDLSPDHRYDVLRRLRRAGISTGHALSMLDAEPRSLPGPLVLDHSDYVVICGSQLARLAPAGNP